MDTLALGRDTPKSIRQVFRTDELTRFICEDIFNDSDHGPKALVNIACVQKAMGGVALDMLWEDVSLKDVLRLFPSDAMGKDDQGLLIFIRTLLPADFQRLRVQYAPRIKTLRRNHVAPQHADKPRTINFLNILHNFTFSLRNQRPLFPNLTCIDWSVGVVQEFMNLAPLYGPNITTFIASIRPAAGAFQFYADPLLEVGLSVPMQNLRDLCPQLTQLDVDYSQAGFMLELPEIIRMPCEALFQKCIHLVTVRVTLTPGLMYILGQLPRLRNLYTTLCQWGGETPPFDIEPPPSASPPFPVLNHLVIMTILISDVYAVLRRARCFPRQSLKIVFCQFPRAKDVSKLLDVVIHPVVSKHLTHFELGLGPLRSSADAPTQEDFNLWKVTLEDFKPLLGCRDMEVFSFNSGFPLALGDSELKKIISAWPKISHLFLGADQDVPGEEFHSSEISIDGLACLAKCVNLRELGITFTFPDTPPSPVPLSTATPASQLETIYIGCTRLPPNWTVAMALYLARHFPRLETIEYSEDLDDDHMEKWNEVGAGLQAVRQESLNASNSIHAA